MPINFSPFVFQPRPLQQFDFGQGFRDVIQARQGRRNSDLYERSLDDVNKRHVYDKDLASYNSQLEIAKEMRKAAQAFDTGTVEALAPTFQQMGGTYRRTDTADPNKPDYYIETGRRPSFGPQQPEQPTVGKSFEMRSPFPASGGGELFAGETNMFDPPGLPGASAEAAQPSAQAASAGAEPVSAQNPMNPPAFSPYRISTADAYKRNQAQARPFLQSVAKAAPPSPINIGELGEGALSAGRPLGTTVELFSNALDPLVKIYGGQQAALAAQGRLEQSKENAENLREDKYRREAISKTKSIVQNDNLAKAKLKLAAAREAASLVDVAVRNPNAANSLVTKLYNMNEDGLITNTDFTRTSEGLRTLADSIKNKTLSELFGRTKINPLMARDIKELIRIATTNQQDMMRLAAEKMAVMLRTARSEAERLEYLDGFRVFFPEEYWPEEMQPEPWEDGSFPTDSPEASPPPAGNNVGRAPVPATLDGRGQTPVGPGVRGSRVPPKPPRQPPKPEPAPGTKPQKLSDDDIDGMSDLDTLRMLQQLRKEREADD